MVTNQESDTVLSFLAEDRQEIPHLPVASISLGFLSFVSYFPFFVGCWAVDSKT